MTGRDRHNGEGRADAPLDLKALGGTPVVTFTVDAPSRAPAPGERVWLTHSARVDGVVVVSRSLTPAPAVGEYLTARGLTPDAPVVVATEFGRFDLTVGALQAGDVRLRRCVTGQGDG